MATVLVSHRLADQSDADRLVQELAPRWTVVTHPISPEAAKTWQADCRRLLGTADALICVVGDTTADGENIDWELREAIDRGAPVIAVRAERSVAPVLPRRLRERGDVLVTAAELPARLDEVVLERAG